MALEQIAAAAYGLGGEGLGPGVGAEELAEGAVDAGVGVAGQLRGLALGEL